jgi:hypothetical protein
MHGSLGGAVGRLTNPTRQKEIARMLIAGSAYVRQIGQKYGQEGARDYVNQTARAVCQVGQERTVGRGRSQQLELER